MKGIVQSMITTLNCLTRSYNYYCHIFCSFRLSAHSEFGNSSNILSILSLWFFTTPFIFGFFAFFCNNVLIFIGLLSPDLAHSYSHSELFSGGLGEGNWGLSPKYPEHKLANRNYVQTLQILVPTVLNKSLVFIHLYFVSHSLAISFSHQIIKILLTKGVENKAWFRDHWQDEVESSM